MRVTNKMLSNNFLADMKTNLENINQIQQQNTSGKKFRKPSDDPFAVARSMQLHTDINTNKQYGKNITDTSNWLDTTDTALGQVGDVLQRVRELIVSAGNAAYGSDERRAIKDEINEKVGEMSQILNTSFGGVYIFGGNRGTTKPVNTVKDDGNVKLVYNGKDGGELEESDNEYNQIKGKLKVQVSQGVNMDYNVSAVEILQFKNEESNPKDLREILSNIVTHLDGKNVNNLKKKDPNGENTDPVKALLNGDLKDITDAMSNLLKIRAEVGAKQNRMEGADERNKDGTFNMTEILSKHEDVDYTQNMMDYATMLSVYMASLQTSAKIIQPSLMDYLR
ncbi:flagellin [Clostridium novyi A str. 4570]|uniref:Flagellin n=1 Tax=Clostridium novyi A str. 4570 TaxID=1444290 RepID=A0AA88ZRM5_CLONO|nr:flagellar hook-associated protein FlgL [Clostridium novyi]KGN03432.1 flagellin [Clostridium novyi A str. 4570]